MSVLIPRADPRIKERLRQVRGQRLSNRYTLAGWDNNIRLQ